jgi:ABC-2 type transport system ATP-binding protein
MPNQAGPIEVRSLTKRYGARTALNSVSFTVQPGQVTGFLGPNGAGKSTTLRAIVGLDRPTAGTATISGRRYSELTDPLSQVGALLDAGAAHPSRTAHNHLRWIAASQGIRTDRISEVLELTGLGAAASTKVGRFSLGMTQRLGIAVALLGDPHTLVLDEPVNGLDPDGVTWMRELLNGLAAEGRTVFLSSHLLGELSLIATHIIVIGRGEIIADAPLTDLLTTTAIVRVRCAEPALLAERLSSAGVTTTLTPTDLLEISGLAPERIAQLAASAGIVLTEITPVLRSLEEAYNEITRGAVEFSDRDSLRSSGKRAAGGIS